MSLDFKQKKKNLKIKEQNSSFRKKVKNIKNLGTLGTDVDYQWLTIKKSRVFIWIKGAI